MLVWPAKSFIWKESMWMTIGKVEIGNGDCTSLRKLLDSWNIQPSLILRCATMKSTCSLDDLRHIR